MKEVYKGYEISYVEYAEEFSTSIGNTSYSNKSLSKVRKHIDDLDKKDFKRTPVFIGSYRGDFSPVVITSESQERHDLYVWTIDESKSRSKSGINYVFADNPENRDKIQTVKELKEKIKVIENQIRETIDSMEKYKPQTKASDEQEQP